MTLKKRQQDGGGAMMSRLVRSNRTQVVPMSAPVASATPSQRYAVAPRSRLSPPTSTERETMMASMGLIQHMLETIHNIVPLAFAMLQASIQAQGFLPSLEAYKREYIGYDIFNNRFRQRFHIPPENPSQLYDLYSYYKHAEAFNQGTNYNLLRFDPYPYGTSHRPNYTTGFYRKCMDFYDLLHPRQTTLLNDPDTREVYPIRASRATRASLASLATQASRATRTTPAQLPGAVSAPAATEIPFEYAVYENPNPGEKENAPPCIACDEETDIEGKWIFTVSYPYKNNQTGKTETKTHYYDYENVIKNVKTNLWEHPILMGTHRIDLNEIRRLGRLNGAPTALQTGGGGTMSRPRVPSPEELTRIQSFKQILDDLIQNILGSRIIARGLAAVFAEAEHRPFLATQEAFEAAYPAVRDIYEPRFRTAMGQQLPTDITLYRLYRLYMHAVYCLKTPPDYNLLGYSNRRNNTYDAEVLAVVAPIQRAARVYLDRVERLRVAVHGARRPSTEALIKTHLTPAEAAATAVYDLTYDVKLKEPTDTGEVCFPCDRLDDIDGTEVFIVGYKLPGKKDSYKHYYDYAAIQREPMVRSRYMKHPLLTRENVWIDLDAIREKMAALVASRARQARQSGGRLRRPTSSAKD